jgi:hypothetical protein
LQQTTAVKGCIEPKLGKRKMLSLKKFQSGTALAIALSMTSAGLAPLSLAASANATPAPYTLAQLFPSQRTAQQLRIPAGAVLPVTYDKGEKIVVAPNEKLPITLTISRNVRSSAGTLLIPSGSRVEGELRPATGGSQFVANTLVMTNGDRLPLDASSDVVTRKETISKGTNVGGILTGAAIGSGAAAIISGVTGNRKITLGKVLIGTGAGALGGWLLAGQKKAEVVVIDPNTDLNLTLNSALALK